MATTFSRQCLRVLGEAGQVMGVRHLALLGAGLNFGIECLEMSGMPRKASLLVLRAPVETCAAPQASAAIGCFLATAAFSKLVNYADVAT
eukprot:7408772-Pyramimonas_sp.AAC.1